MAAVEWETFLAWMIELRRCGPLDMVATSEEVRKTNLESHRSWKNENYFVSHEWKVWQGVNKWAQFSKLAVPEKVKTDSFAWRRRWTRCESPSFRAMVSSSLLHGSRLLKNARPLRFAVGENPGICSEAVLAFWWKRTWEPKSGRLINKLCWLKSGLLWKESIPTVDWSHWSCDCETGQVLKHQRKQTSSSAFKAMSGHLAVALKRRWRTGRRTVWGALQV